MLLDAVLFFVMLTAFLVAFTYLYLGLKKRTFFSQDRIKKSLELWISHVILSEEDEEVHIPPKFTKMFKHPTARQYAIENLIINKRSFSGAVAGKIRDLYEKLGFRNDSVKKMKSSTWFIKAKGIQELAIMDQNDQLISIYRLTNSKNDLVRNEAQNAIIQWSGFNGLRFLDVVTYEISEWQQIQLLTLLKGFVQEEMPKLPGWLSSSNDTVVLFSLKLAETYQQFRVKEQVEACLTHANEKVRVQAVNTLAKIGDAESAAKLILQYYNESQQNKINILNKLSAIATDAHLPFLTAELSGEDDFLKLSAARAIGELNHFSVLEEKATEQPDPYEYIFKHIKSELAF